MRHRRRHGAALTDVVEHPVMASCQQHKIRSVRDRLAQWLSGPVERRMRTACALDAHAQLEALACELDKPHPGAAAWLRAGMAETLRVLRWVDRRRPWAPKLHSTNPIASMIETCGEHAGNARALTGRQAALALVRRGDGRGRQAVRPRQWLPAPGSPPRRAGS